MIEAQNRVVQDEDSINTKSWRNDDDDSSHTRPNFLHDLP